MNKGNYLALDVGRERVGLAFADAIAKLPRPIRTVSYQESIDAVRALIREENIGTLVVGMPLSQDGSTNEQVDFTNKFIEKLAKEVTQKIVTCDESTTSKRAKQELDNRKVPYAKEDIDALAATYILEDYLRESGIIA